MLFHGKEDLLSLYNALNHTNYQDSDDLEITTIEDTIYMGFKNDVSFLIGIDYMNLYEAQSTGNPNMPIRGVSYFGHLYQAYVKKKKLNLYGKKQIKLPTPRYVVLYTGPEEEPDMQEYRLSNAFSDKESACLECIATVLNVNIGHNQEILDQCRLLYEYSYFLQTVRKCVEDSEGNKADAIDKAVRLCIKEGILADFLIKHRSEVINVLLTEYDYDAHMEAIREEGIEIGEARAEAKERARSIMALISMGKRCRISRERTRQNLMEEYSLKEEEADKYLDLHWQRVE